MGAGSHFGAMPNVQLRGSLRSVAPFSSARTLSSVRHVTWPLCLPVPSARHPTALRGRRQLQTRAVVATPEKVENGSAPPFQAWTTGAAIKKREDIKSIMILGAGPIVIGQVLLCCSCTQRLHVGLLQRSRPLQASEFDYSGTQACKALK